jgi:hypothetical protein
LGLVAHKHLPAQESRARVIPVIGAVYKTSHLV